MEETKYIGGFIPQEIGDDEWVFGGQERPDILADGNWTQYLPNPERQATKYFDPYSCVSMSLCHAIETQLDFLMGQDATIQPILASLGCLDDNGKVHLAGRFVAVGSGTVPGQGNSQKAVFEFVRKNGLVGEKFWPCSVDLTQDQYYSTIPQSVYDQAKKFLQYFDFNYEAILDDNQDLKSATKKGTICVCVGGAYLGNEAGALLYRNNGTPTYNHQVQYYNQEQNVSDFNQIIPIIHDIFDTYDPFQKRFASTYPFAYAKIVYLKKKIKNMFYKTPDKSAVYQLGADGLYYPILDGTYFKKLFGSYANASIITQQIPQEKVAPTGIGLNPYNLGTEEIQFEI